MKAKTNIFEIMVNDRPVTVAATAYEANGSPRYRVSYNGSPVFIFAWDLTQSRLIIIDSGSEKMPRELESIIAAELALKLAA